MGDVYIYVVNKDSMLKIAKTIRGKGKKIKRIHSFLSGLCGPSNVMATSILTMSYREATFPLDDFVLLYHVVCVETDCVKIFYSRR